MSLLDKIGGTILGYDYMKLRDIYNEASAYIQRDKPMYQLPYDHSPYGSMYDKALRLLPPSLRYQAKREMDMNLYKGQQTLRRFINNAVDIAKESAKEAIKSGAISLVKKLTSSKVEKVQSGDIPWFERKVPKLPISDNDEGINLSLVPDESMKDPVTGLSGYKVRVGKGYFHTDSSKDAGSNELASKDLSAMNKFKPRDEELWYITLGRYEGEFGTALPEIPAFVPKVGDIYDPGTKELIPEDSLSYLDWLPAVRFAYTRRNVHSAISTAYGWSHEFSQVSSITRGKEFSLTLQDDRNHTFSNYAREVINRSASYERASVTYWECLVHRITIFILDKQWRVREKFTLLGILLNDGSNRFGADGGDEGIITYRFNIVGELRADGTRKIDHLDINNSLPESKTNLPI